MEAKIVMTLRSGDYIEIPAPEEEHPYDGVCHYCALNRTKDCASAITGAAEKAFGGDCDTRDVVYVRATQ